jgi:hypothetical protein
MKFFKAAAVGILSFTIVACGVGGQEEATVNSEEQIDGSTTGGFTGTASGGTTGSSGGTSTGTTTGSTGGSTLAPSLNCGAAYCSQLTATCESGNIRLNWGSDGRSTAYRILKRPDGGSNTQIDVSGTTYLDNSITRGIRYIYRVKYGSASASNEAAATCP